MAEYLNRLIDFHLTEWKESRNHKPLLVRGARQVGKSSSVRHLGRSFKHFIEVNFEYRPELKRVFEDNQDVKTIASILGKLFNKPIIPGETLLFFDEIQACPPAIKSLWFFKEDFPDLHVIAAGSLLEFTLKEMRSFAVGRVRSLFMYPLSFSEFLCALGKQEWERAISEADPEHPLPQILHDEIVKLFRVFMIVGGMPASVKAWRDTGDFRESAGELTDIQQSYYDDFAKYNSKIGVRLLRNTLKAVVDRNGKKFIYSRVEGAYRSDKVKAALSLLCDAGLITPLFMTAANGLPLGAEVNDKFVKYLYLDSGLLLRMLDLYFGGVSELSAGILTDTASALVNKGGIAEMIVGWELVKHSSPLIKHDLYYWENIAKGASAEVDFITTRGQQILPVEVKSGVSGKMKSLHIFMQKRHLNAGIRSSLENFGQITYNNPEGESTVVDIIPAYAIGNICIR